jgi:hypothetical protein
MLATPQTHGEALLVGLVDQLGGVLLGQVDHEIWVAEHCWLLRLPFVGDSSIGSGTGRHIVSACVS